LNLMPARYGAGLQRIHSCATYTIADEGVIIGTT
jgi:hypothetical protein